MSKIHFYLNKNKLLKIILRVYRILRSYVFNINRLFIFKCIINQCDHGFEICVEYSLWVQFIGIYIHICGLYKQRYACEYPFGIDKSSVTFIKCLYTFKTNQHNTLYYYYYIALYVIV